MKTLLLALTLLIAAALPTQADVITLKNGSQIEGRVTDLGSELSISMRFGAMKISKAKVRRIERKSSLEEQYETRLAKTNLTDPEERVALGRWLENQHWRSQARKEYRTALTLSRHHRGAHEALGHIFHAGAWRTEREAMQLRGMVRLGGKWVTQEEAARHRSQAERQRLLKEQMKARRKLERRLNSLIRDVALGSQRRCDAAYEELVVMAREERIVGLEQFAADARDYYDRYWTLVRRHQNLLVEATVTKATLKRPIRNFTTGLGSSSSPVTFQLPEVSIASVRTTIMIPAGRGKP